MKNIMLIIPLLIFLLPLASAALTVTFESPTPSNGTTVYNNLLINTLTTGSDYANTTTYVYYLSGGTFTIVSKTNGSSSYAINLTGLEEKTYYFNSSSWDTSNNKYDSETRQVNYLSTTTAQNRYYVENNKDLYTTAFGIILFAVGAVVLLVNILEDIETTRFGGEEDLSGDSLGDE